MDLEFEKLKMNRKRVAFGVEELEFKKLELKAQMERIEDNIKISKSKLSDLEEEIKSFKE